MNKEIYLLTKNKGKILAAQSFFSKFGIEVKNIDKEFPEIQAMNSLEIAQYSALQAAQEFKVPVVREDHSLFINALGGFPGPYTSYFDRTIPVEKLLELLKDVSDRSGYFEIAAAYAKPSGEVKTYVFRVPIKISNKVQGNNHNWDKAIMFPEETRTFSEMSEEENVKVWSKNFLAIGEEICKEAEKFS
jgi:XTP/dITP diphosphohydrolase